MANLPTRRDDVTGQDLDGNEITLSLGIARKLYRCPGCRQSLVIGEEHVVVARRDVSGDSYHQHWHTDCARTLAREMEIAAGKGRQA